MRARVILTTSVLALLALPVGARAQAGVYTTCPADGETIVVEVAATTCEDAAPVVAELVAKPADEAPSVLSAAGWSAVRAQPAETDGQYDVLATRGLATLRVRLRGTAPDVDGWEGGRELLFARRALVGGKPPPRGASLCTSAFLVRLRSGRLGGLSAGHCGGLRKKDRTVQRRNAALRRPPVPGLVLGRVLRILQRSKPYDALVLPVVQSANRPASPLIERGIERPPWRVVATARPLSGRAICMTGRTSGVDKCGRIASSRARRTERLVSHLAGTIIRCTTIRAAPGDSGGPVYTKPAADGTVRAVGLVTLIIRPAGDLMCFTPIKPVLSGLGAKLVAAQR